MRTFKCASVIDDCNVVLTAKTEELLADMAALHVRDVHGMTEITPDMVGKIKNLFASPTSVDAAGSVDRIFEEYNCDRDPQCTWRYIAQAEAIITGRGTPHLQEVQGA